MTCPHVPIKSVGDPCALYVPKCSVHSWRNHTPPAAGCPTLRLPACNCLPCLLWAHLERLHILLPHRSQGSSHLPELSTAPLSCHQLRLQSGHLCSMLPPQLPKHLLVLLPGAAQLGCLQLALLLQSLNLHHGLQGKQARRQAGGAGQGRGDCAGRLPLRRQARKRAPQSQKGACPTCTGKPTKRTRPPTCASASPRSCFLRAATSCS
jgi:hypothetical protein